MFVTEEKLCTESQGNIMHHFRFYSAVPTFGTCRSRGRGFLMTGHHLNGILQYFA